MGNIPGKVILDCDNTMGRPDWEVDDGLVILYLLGRCDIDLLGITNTFGNASLREVEFYTKKMLKDIGREDIPRFNGEAFHRQNRNLHLAIEGKSRYRGELIQEPHPTSAARFLAETVNKYPGEVTILAAGPLGNLYDAWMIDPEFFSKVKEIVLMGGYLYNLKIGHVYCSELNLACNPRASLKILFAECPVTVMNGHVCLQAPFRKEDIERCAHFWAPDRIKILENWLNAFGKTFEVDAFYLWDLLPAVYITNPDVFERNEIWINPCESDLETGMLKPSEEGRGTMINMPLKIINHGLFMELLFDAWKCQALDLKSS